MKPNKDKQVLMAILNVKKYASALKKKASNLQQINTDNGNAIDAVSSPSFFQTPPNEYIELSSPLLQTKSSYNQTFQSMTRQKKCNDFKYEEHSMSYLPGPKKMQRQNRKYSNAYLNQPASPAKTYNHIGQRSGLSHSYKCQVNISKISNEGMKKKDSGQNCLNLQRKSSLIKQKQINNQSQFGFQRLNQTISIPFNIARDKSRDLSGTVAQRSLNAQNPKMVEQLLLQISKLKNHICDYKKALVYIKDKYIQLQQKCKQKVESDHMLDVMKSKIQDLENQKRILNQTILKQNQKISKFSQTVLEISNKFRTHYFQQISKMIKLDVLNKAYKQLLKLNNIEKYNIQQPSSIASSKYQKKNNQKNINQKILKQTCQVSSESESDTNSSRKQILVSITICKNQKDFQNKYDKKQNKLSIVQ